MTDAKPAAGTLVPFIAGGGLLAGLYLTSYASFLLFHTLVELFSVLVAGGIFVIAWNSRRFAGNSYFLFIGIAHLCIGVTDLLHALAYKGMGVFPGGGANLPTQLWIAARYLQSVSFVLAPLFVNRRLRPRIVLAAFLAVTGLLFASIFSWGLFPVCYVDGAGVTLFKTWSEYAIALLFLAGLVLLRQRRAAFDRHVLDLLSGALVLLVGTELAFSRYISVYGPSNLVGHLLKAAAVFLIYRGTIETALTRPYDLLFRELKAGERALRESHQRVSSLLESITDAFFSLDREWRFTYLNSEAERLLGKSRAELLDRDLWTIFPETVGSAFDTGYRRAVTANEAVTFEGYYPSLERWFEVHAYPSREGLSVFFQDITARKRADEKLRASEERFATVFRIAPTIMVISSLQDGRYLEVNAAFEQHLGWRREEALGRTYLDLGVWENPADREAIRAVIDREGEVHDREIMVRGKGGESIVGLYSGVTIELNGETCLLSLIRNITARKRAEREVELLNVELESRATALEDMNCELEEANCELEATVEQLETVNHELEAANTELEAFNYSVSHDLRRPLTNINGYSQVILELFGNGLDEQCRQFVANIYDETKRMDHLIGTLLNFSRISRCDIRLVTVDLSDMVWAVAQKLKMKEPERQVTLTIAEGMTAYGDAGLLHVVVDNLLGNAWKYTGKREHALIEFGVTDIDGSRTHFVRDNGAGFAMDQVERIFAPFQRLHHPEDFPGEGIGLATVARIVQRHGGRIWAEGTVDRGATFYFTL
ncbi:histidine kinase [Geotalea uraniireducens]|uniref:histidine kinase n=1 Tax=Geotalea uraniireducens TaxID=351604 RepID=A0ABM8EHY6_9BACT|nr:MASE3 domain-containing protein [Geotalea uraniireducens]BDV41856.1 histidine kinase [Geotalea uraniireducens]